MMQDYREPPAWVHLIVAFVVVAIGSLAIGGPVFSMMCIGSGITLLFGALLIRAAWLTQNDGWVAGAAFGGIIVLIGAAATVLSLVFLTAFTQA